jgi:hypothetical protein
MRPTHLRPLRIRLFPRYRHYFPHRRHQYTQVGSVRPSPRIVLRLSQSRKIMANPRMGSLGSVIMGGAVISNTGLRISSITVLNKIHVYQARNDFMINFIAIMTVVLEQNEIIMTNVLV